MMLSRPSICHLRRAQTWVLLVGICLVVTGCSNVKEAIIPGKQAPDEFAVYTRAPLSLPPDYSLRAPEPGAERPQNVNPQDVARQVTIGTLDQQPDAPIAATEGLSELLVRTGANEAEPDIRALVDSETSVLSAEADSVVQNLLFWRDDPGYGVEVDPDEETKRIRENQALGDPITKGDVPIIERKEKGLLEGVF